jgi:hypothetical protein
MGYFLAKLTGESDGFIDSREFAEKHEAIHWVQNAGLLKFQDQAARGEVFSSDGSLVWCKGNMMTSDQAKNERNQELARSGFIPYPLRGVYRKLKKGS